MGGLRAFPLEDIAVALWVRDLDSDGSTVNYVEEQRFSRVGMCRTPREPFTSTPMAVNSISFGSPHGRPTLVHRTCGELNEIKKNIHLKNITLLFLRAGDTALNVLLERGAPLHLEPVRYLSMQRRPGGAPLHRGPVRQVVR